MRGRLAGKVAIVTGASSGIGAATAAAFAREGARVALVARRELEGEQAAAAARKAAGDGGDAAFIVGDVTVPEDVARVVDEVSARWGPALHCLFNNVGGVALVSGAREEQLEDFEATLRLSLTSVWTTTRACWEALCLAEGASVINNSSSAAVATFTTHQRAMLPFQLPSSYFAAKAGVEALTRHFASIGSEVGVRCNAVRPGQIETPAATFRGAHFAQELLTSHQLTPRPGSPADVAETVTFLASDAASFINGAIIDVDGGLVLKI